MSNTNIEWTEDTIALLMACITPMDFAVAFPGRNVETLKRRQREFKNNPQIPAQAMEDIPDADGSLQLTGDSGVIQSGTVDAPITDWTDTLSIWGLDPEQFEVIEPVTMKAWDSGSGRKFSYGAKIQKKIVTENLESTLDIAGWREDLKALTYVPRVNVAEQGSGVSYLIMVADPQLGKPGTKDALTSWTKGIEGHMDRIHMLRDSGVMVNQVALAFMGDEHEGAVGNYMSQPYEIELNYSEQVELDFDMRLWSIRTLLEAELPIVISSVPSNHGEHTRFGSAKVLTSIYDNSSTMVASLVAKTFTESRYADSLTWEIAKDKQDTTLNLNGIKANFTHGHIAKGSGSATGGLRSKNAIEKQIVGRTEELFDTKLFFTAHYHHFNMLEDRGRTFFGCPALEAEKSSDWFYSQYGVWSKPGMLGLVVGKAAGERGWDELSVL